MNVGFPLCIFIVHIFLYRYLHRSYILLNLFNIVRDVLIKIIYLTRSSFL